MIKIILFFHVIFAIIWIGGMIYTLFFLKPALNNIGKNERITIMREANGKFFLAVAISIIGLLLSGIILIKNFRPDLLSNGLFHAKLTLFAFMVFNFIYIYLWLYRKQMFGRIPQFVGINLIMGIIIVFIITYIR